MDLSKTSIFIATPCYGGMAHCGYVLSIINFLSTINQFGLKYRIYFLQNESLITRARNELATIFLEYKEEFTHLFFIDSDLVFEPEAIYRLLIMDKDVIVAAYPKKGLPIDYAINPMIRIFGEDTGCLVDSGLIELKDGATGFMCIKRKVIEQMREAYPELKYKSHYKPIDPEQKGKFAYALFDTMIDEQSNVFLSEDYSFCRRWQKMGGQVWLHPEIKLTHLGGYAYEGDTSKIYNPGQLVKLEDKDWEEANARYKSL